MLYERADIPSNLLAFEDKPVKRLFIELNLQNTKILINRSYKSEIKKAFDSFKKSLRFTLLTLSALRLIHDYLSSRKQRTRIDDNYS